MKNKIAYLIMLIVLTAVNGFSFLPKAEVDVWITPTEIEAGSEGLISVKYVYPPGLHQILQEEYFYFEVYVEPGFQFGEIQYPDGILKDDGFIHLYDESVLTRSISIDSSVQPGSYTLEIFAAYQLCYDDTGACLMPENEEFTIDVTVLPGSSKSPLVLYLLLALIGGFILNLTPCVLPVLSLRAFSLINQSQSDRKRITISSLVYSLGVIVSFLILALIIILLKTTGQLVGWGFQFQNSTFVAVMTSIIFVFSLSLFDVFTILAPDSAVADRLSRKEGFAGSFFMGIFAVLLGTPCTAPVLGAALAFAFAQPASTIVLMFLFIGIGMAVPFLLIAVKPHIVNKLPKPGEWMNVLKELMGFLLLLWAVKMLEVLYYQIGGEGLISFLFFLLTLALSVRLIGRFVRPETAPLKKWLVLLLAVILVTAVGMNTLKLTNNQRDLKTDSDYIRGNWQTFSPERVESARQEGKPVFIDFTAKWCTTCYTNEITVLFTNDIQEEFARKGVELFIADFTSYDEIIAQRIQSYGRVGVPVYVFYLPDEEEPILLPEIITKGMVLDVLDRLP